MARYTHGSCWGGRRARNSASRAVSSSVCAARIPNSVRKAAAAPRRSPGRTSATEASMRPVSIRGYHPPADTGPGRVPRGKEGPMLRENLRLARPFLALLAIFAVARWVMGVRGVDYSQGHHVFSLVTLTTFASVF